ncbi:MAG TPA: hypothetical protein VJ792_05860, partial [Candidatus Nitrosotalea sp.]|nr:hypothetical protein [Candidatus Nitrosotalea sp.]
HIYKISHIPPEAVEHSSEMLERSSLHLTVKELKVYGALKEGATADLIQERTGISAYDVMGNLWKLERKGLVERGYAETRNRMDSPARGSVQTEAKRQEYFVQTGKESDLKRPAPPREDESHG